MQRQTGHQQHGPCPECKFRELDQRLSTSQPASHVIFFKDRDKNAPDRTGQRRQIELQSMVNDYSN